MMMTTKTKTTDKLVAATSALRKDVEEIADLITFLTRDLSLLWAVEVNIKNISVDREEEGRRGKGADTEYDNNRDNFINNNDDASEPQLFLSLSLPPPLVVTTGVIIKM